MNKNLSAVEPGVHYEDMPERVDAICSIHFEEAPPEHPERADWHRKMLRGVALEVGVPYDIRLALMARVSYDEAGGWSELGKLAVAAGFGVYDSDSYFELYPKGAR